MASFQALALVHVLVAVLLVGDRICTVNGQHTLQFTFRGAVYPNNTGYILLSEIDTANLLICTTTRTDCCMGDNGLGEFHFFNGNPVPTRDMVRSNRMYRERGVQQIRLGRVPTSEVTGGTSNVYNVYWCAIPDSSGNSQRIYINIVQTLPEGYIPPPRVVTISPITSSGSNIASQQFNLTCTATVEGSYTPTITWLDGNSMTVPSGGGDTRIVFTVMSSGSTHTSILQFDPLQSSHAGTYTCQVSVLAGTLTMTEMRSTDVTISAALIQLRMSGLANCHEWALTDTRYISSKINEVVYTLVTAVETECQCGFSRSHITEDAFQCFPGSETHVTFRARISNTLSASTPQLISYVEQWLLSTEYIVVLRFRLIFNTTCDFLIAKFGDPECPAATVTKPSERVTKELFQLKFGSTEHCITWNSNKAKEVQSDIHKAILQALTSRCQCTIPEDNILKGVFSCQDSQDQTTYRSTIAGTQSHNATELVEFIQDWVHSRPTMTIQWYTVKVDHTCPVHISSLGDPECGIDPERRLCIDRAIARCTA